MKASFEEAVAFHRIAQEWIRFHMKEMLPPHLFAIVDAQNRGWQKKVNAWMKENSVEVQIKKNGGVRIIKSGMLHAHLVAPKSEPDVSNN